MPLKEIEAKRGRPKEGMIENKRGNRLTIALGQKAIEYSYKESLKGIGPEGYNLSVPEWQSYKAPKDERKLKWRRK